MSTPTASGLREAKKRATARELAIAAYTLVRERGYDAVTIDDIAADAGYSRRTFANHYAGKPEAVVDGVTAMLSDEMNTPFLRGAILCSKIWYPDPST